MCLPLNLGRPQGRRAKEEVKKEGGDNSNAGQMPPPSKHFTCHFTPRKCKGCTKELHKGVPKKPTKKDPKCEIDIMKVDLSNNFEDFKLEFQLAITLIQNTRG